MKEIDDHPYVCQPCGKKYMDEMGYKIPKDSVSTYHQGICCCCKQETGVTNERNFRHLYHWRNKTEKS